MKIEIENESEDSSSEELKDWEIEDKIRTLMCAEKIKADEELMKTLQPHIEKFKAAANKITSLAQLKQVAKKKIAEPE